MDTRILIAVLVAVFVVVLLAGWAYARRRRVQRLRERFGPEYDRTVRQQGNVRRAEAELQQREERVERLHIRPLAESARLRYREHWLEVQRRFVDNPSEAIAAADDLVADVMAARGYPVGAFEQRAADISVAHPLVVQHYRLAHAIALREGAGDANTEDLRKAMVSYRSLFEDLLGITTDRREVA
jgi:hypothetical protein